MKSLKPIILTVITAVTLSTGSMAMAETASTVSGDGFLELKVVEVSTSQATKQAVKQAPKASVRAKRATRTERQKRTTRKTYASSYRVRSGDTLTKIAAKFQVSVDRLARLNNLRGAKKNHIEVGQRLRLR